MWLLGFYRILIAVAAGGVAYFAAFPNVFAWMGITILVRTVWALSEMLLNRRIADAHFQQHSQPFKQQFGPFGRAEQIGGARKFTPLDVFEQDGRSVGLIDPSLNFGHFQMGVDRIGHFDQ